MGVVIIPEIEKQSITKLISEGKRLDGRAFDEFRPISIEVGKLGRAEGSAIVKIGDTQVATGVKIGEGEPYPDSPDVGVLSTNAELVPMASPEFRSGPPDEFTIELARVVDRGIRESQCIDLKKLCIEPGEKTRIVYIDNYVLDHDGNFMDAAALAAIAALHNTEIPDFGKLPIVKKPIACTFVKIGGKILLDPTLEEEQIADARLTVTTEDNGNVCAMQKAGPSHWTAEEVMQCVKTSLAKGKEIRKLLK